MGNTRDSMRLRAQNHQPPQQQMGRQGYSTVTDIDTIPSECPIFPWSLCGLFKPFERRAWKTLESSRRPHSRAGAAGITTHLHTSNLPEETARCPAAPPKAQRSKPKAQRPKSVSREGEEQVSHPRANLPLQHLGPGTSHLSL